MKHFITGAVVTVLAVASCHSAFGANYGQRIVAPPELAKVLQASVEDADATLEKMTGQAFETAGDYAGPGIYLLRRDTPATPAAARAKLAKRNPGAFLISSDGTDVLRIVGNSDAAIAYGLYHYLEQLGARWLMPNPNWTVIPARKDIRVKSELVIEPAYRFRQFGGTGGFGRSFPFDPGEAVRNRARWETWQRRLRLGSESKLGGHSYHAVYLRHKKEFEAHPEYLALVDGKRMSTQHDDIKFDVSNRGLVELYVKDRVEEFRQARAKDPNFFAVSVDPSDGYNHCNSGPCTKIGNGSPSDQVFYLANETARAIRKEFPDGHVSLYAYNRHAMLPSFPLEPNIYVMIIPYAFQNTGLRPQELIEAWHKKVPRMGIYDYWGMPGWTHDLPSFNYLSTAASRLRMWHENGVDGFVNESSYTGGAMGLTWYLSSKLMWDPSQPVEPILDDWYQAAYGPARAPMQRMMERWARDFAINSGEVGNSLRDLVEARSLAKGRPDVDARLLDMARYVNYMRLYLEHEIGARELRAVARKGTPEVVAAATSKRDEAALRLQRYLWNIYDSSMIHAFRLNQILKTPAEIRARYRQGQKDAPGWAEITPLSDADIAKMLAEQAPKYPPLGFQIRTYSGDWTRVPASAAGRNMAPADGYSAFMFTGGDANRPGNYDLVALPGMDKVRIKVVSGGKGIVRLKNSDGKVLHERIVQRTAQPQFEEFDVDLAIPAPGRYVIELDENAAMRAPAGVPILLQPHKYVNSQFLYGRFPHLYFYVPKGLKRIALDIPYELKPTFYNPAGEQVQPVIMDGGKLFLVDVPAGQDGKVWSVKDLISPKGIPVTLLNVPRVYSFFPDTLYVPAEALAGVR